MTTHPLNQIPSKIFLDNADNGNADETIFIACPSQDLGEIFLEIAAISYILCPRIFVVQERLNPIGYLGFVLYGKAVYEDTKPSVQAASTPVL